MTNKAFVLGLDGVPWRFIEQWSASGDLPNFARVIRDGAAGPFDSTRPATTPVAWPSIATGVRPDKHGLYGFHELTEDYSHELNTSEDVDSPALWDMLAPAVVANVPMTYPATSVDGTMVSGMIAPEMDDQFTFPPEFCEDLQREIPDYRISLSWGEYTDDSDRFLDEFEELIARRRELMRLLMERHTDWELFFFMYTGPDRLQHLFWDEDVILDHYRTLDDILGEVMEYVSDVGGNLYVVSDHGFGPVERRVHANSLLRDAGYLTENKGSMIRSVFTGLGVDRSDVTEQLDRIGIDEDRIISLFGRDLVEDVARKLPGDHALYDVAFDRTAAFLHLSGAIYVNDTDRFTDGTIDPSDVPSVKRELIDLFEGMSDPETGEPAVEVYDGSELFPTDNSSPDLIVSSQPTFVMNNELRDSQFSDTVRYAASHRNEGIFLAWGPSIDGGATPTDATAFDFTPTVLHSLRKPIPADADGRVLSEIFAPGTQAHDSPVETASYSTDQTTVDVDEEFDEVEDRLKGLGYLD
jgi:predicted AlkP superfamily phosphohydrolase/phosphomutase